MQKQTHHHNNQHRPVLADATLKYLAPKRGESYLDLTAGYGGHAKLVLERTHQPDRMVLVDRDKAAIDALSALSEKGAVLWYQDYLSATQKLHKANRRFDMIMIDAGVSSPQLDIPERGFSFTHSGPLDMRMDVSSETTAADLVNSLKEDELAKIIFEYGQEPKSRIIAREIVTNRPITTTAELVKIIENVVHRRRGQKHPATRTFQALRIAVNNELEQLAETLPLLPDLLVESGRMVIISFHSLEDRLVKQFFKDESNHQYEARLRLLMKKPLSGANEDVNNPRARSAKLRAAEKINTKTERSDHNANKGRS